MPQSHPLENSYFVDGMFGISSTEWPNKVEWRAKRKCAALDNKIIKCTNERNEREMCCVTYFEHESTYIASVVG